MTSKSNINKIKAINETPVIAETIFIDNRYFLTLSNNNNACFANVIIQTLQALHNPSNICV